MRHKIRTTGRRRNRKAAAKRKTESERVAREFHTNAKKLMKQLEIAFMSYQKLLGDKKLLQQYPGIEREIRTGVRNTSAAADALLRAEGKTGQSFLT